MYNLQNQVCWETETPFNIQPNKHRQYVKNANVIKACKHFSTENYPFNKNLKCTLIQKYPKYLNHLHGNIENKTERKGSF